MTNEPCRKAYRECPPSIIDITGHWSGMLGLSFKGRFFGLEDLDFGLATLALQSQHHYQPKN